MFLYIQALAERLQLFSLREHLIVQNTGVNYTGLYAKDKALNGSKITYLFECYSRAIAERTDVSYREREQES